MIFIKNTIFVISSEPYSHAEEVAFNLAHILNIPYHNKNIIKKASELSNINQDVIHQIENNSNYMFIMPSYNIYNTFSINYLHDFEPLQDKIFNAKIKALENIISNNKNKINNSCVIFCKCANYMLSINKKLYNTLDNTKIVNIYIYSDENTKIDNYINNNNINNTNTIKKLIKKNYKNYKNYYLYHTSQSLDNRLLYDVMINTKNITTSECVNIIKNLYT